MFYRNYFFIQIQFPWINDKIKRVLALKPQENKTRKDILLFVIKNEPLVQTSNKHLDSLGIFSSIYPKWLLKPSLFHIVLTTSMQCQANSEAMMRFNHIDNDNKYNYYMLCLKRNGNYLIHGTGDRPLVCDIINILSSELSRSVW